MNHKRIYEALIENKKTGVPDGYTEKHHIVPRSLGGTDEVENIVALTAREHFLCHYLLAKMYREETFEWYKMNHAFMYMKCSSITHQRYFNSRLYEALKKNRSEVMSLLQTGNENSQYATMWISNVNLKQNKKIFKSEPVPEGWIKGRDVWKKIEREAEKFMMKIERFSQKDKERLIRERKENKTLAEKQLNKQLKKELSDRKQKQEAIETWTLFTEGNFNSVNEFSKNYSKSNVWLTKIWKRYIPEYNAKQGQSFKF